MSQTTIQSLLKDSPDQVQIPQDLASDIRLLAHKLQRGKGGLRSFVSICGYHLKFRYRRVDSEEVNASICVEKRLIKYEERSLVVLAHETVHALQHARNMPLIATTLSDTLAIEQQCQAGAILLIKSAYQDFEIDPKEYEVYFTVGCAKWLAAYYDGYVKVDLKLDDPDAKLSQLGPIGDEHP